MVYTQAHATAHPARRRTSLRQPPHEHTAQQRCADGLAVLHHRHWHHHAAECQQRSRHHLRSSLHRLAPHKVSLHLRLREHRRSNGYLLRTESRSTAHGPRNTWRKGCHTPHARLLRLHLLRDISIRRLYDAALRRQRRGCRGEQRCTVHAHQQLLLPHPRTAHHSALLHPGTRLQQPLHAQRRDGDDSTLRCQPMARASYRLDRRLLRRPHSLDYGRPIPYSGIPVGAA